MKPPAFQFYADDFLAGTFTFTNEQRGLYIALLCLQWNQGAIGEETITALAGGMAPEPVAAVRAKFVSGEDDMLRNPRLELERQKQAAFRAKCSEAGRRSVEGRLKVPSGLVEGRGQPEVNSPSPSPSPSPSSVSDPQSPSPKKEVRFAPPSQDEVEVECVAKGMPKGEAGIFIQFYTSKGWMVGKNKMVSWPHALAGWKARMLEKQQKPRPESKQIQEVIQVRML
jgi:uncharacterized protein YdaU (DUF1376 family)